MDNNKALAIRKNNKIKYIALILILFLCIALGIFFVNKNNVLNVSNTITNSGDNMEMISGEELFDSGEKEITDIIENVISNDSEQTDNETKLDQDKNVNNENHNGLNTDNNSDNENQDNPIIPNINEQNANENLNNINTKEQNLNEDLNNINSGEQNPSEDLNHINSEEQNPSGDLNNINSGEQNVSGDLNNDGGNKNVSGETLINSGDNNGSGDNLNKRVIDPSKPMVALTFDDGPDPKRSIQIIEILQEYNSVGTFFDIGNLMERYPSTVKKEIEAGFEVGGHTYTHANLNNLSEEQIKDEIEKVENAYKNITGLDLKYIRPSYGNANSTVKKVVNHPLINWSVDSLDWKSRNADKVIAEIRKTKNLDGKIILMHSIYSSTVEAVRRLVPELIEEGYQLVTVSELAEYKGYKELENGKIYYKF